MLKCTKTKIICTVGPASNSRETIKQMIENGMNVARLNFSHGTHETHRQTIALVRSVAQELGVYVGILQDLCGPKIRLGKIQDEGIMLSSGQEAVFASTDDKIADAIPVDYPNIYKDLKVGERMLIADGMLDLTVTKIEGKRIFCKVINGGLIFSRKGVNMPQSKLQTPSFTAKDKEDLMMGLEEDVDYVALSFVRSAKDLDEIREIISKVVVPPRLIAKIEKPQAVTNLQEILDVVDGVMVARGDLGVEMPLEEIPHVQKKVINAARLSGRLVITATQMLASMVASPRPTRGETTDVANAVLDGTDALMLSDETANGKYPVLAVETLSKIARAAEPYSVSSLSLDNSNVFDIHSFTWAIGRAACWLAKDMKAKAIISFTTSGFAAYCISRFRPDCSILALTVSETICKRMTLIWGTVAKTCEPINDTDKVVEVAKQKAVEEGVAEKGDTIIVTAGVPFGESNYTSFLRIVTID